MFHASIARRAIWQLNNLLKPSLTGYQVAEMPNESVLSEFLAENRERAVLAILTPDNETCGDHGVVNAPSPAAVGSASVAPSGLRLPTAKTALGAAAAAAVTPAPAMPGISAEVNRFLASFHRVPLGDPDCVRIAILPASKAPRLIERSNVLVFPTSLLFFNMQVVDRVVGMRAREASTKVRFLLRREGLNIYSIPGLTTVSSP